jgi:hypothetical protein
MQNFSEEKYYARASTIKKKNFFYPPTLKVGRKRKSRRVKNIKDKIVSFNVQEINHIFYS